MARYSIEKIRQLPEAVRNRFFDFEVNEKYAEEIYPLLTPAQNEAVTDLMLDVYFAALKPADFAMKVKELTKEDKVASEVAVKVMGYAFYPLAEYFNVDIFGLIKENGGDPNIFRKKVPVGDVVAVIRQKAAIEIIDARVSHRLDSILMTKLNGARKDEQVIDALMGPSKTSGCGLDEATAKVLVALSNEEILKLQKIGVVIVSDEEYKKELADKAAAEAVAEDAVVKKPAAEVITVTDDIEREARDMAAKMSSTKFDSKTADPFDLAVQQKIEDAVGFCGSFCPTGDMKKRFQALVETYFRDLRDAAETRAKLMLPMDQGGMAMGEGDADEAMARLKAKAQEYRKAMQDKVDVSKKKYVAAQTQKLMSATEIQAAQEQAGLEKRFADLTKKSKRPSPSTPSVSEPPLKPLPLKAVSLPKVIPVIGLDEKKSAAPPVVNLSSPSAVKTSPPPMNLPTVESAPPASSKLMASVKPAVQAESTTSVASQPVPPIKPAVTAPVPPVPKIPERQAAALLVAPPPPAAVSAPPSVRPVIPKAEPTVAPSSAAVARPAIPVKPSMSDVAYSPKLIGPIEELHSMTLVDFRRLSKDPKEAILKLKDKVDLLTDQSYENKTKAVKAWQESEPNRLYLELLKRSLEGKPVNELIEEKVAKGEIVLNKAEFDAVMAFNRMLRFG